MSFSMYSFAAHFKTRTKKHINGCDAFTHQTLQKSSIKTTTMHCMLELKSCVSLSLPQSKASRTLRSLSLLNQQACQVLYCGNSSILHALLWLIRWHQLSKKRGQKVNRPHHVPVLRHLIWKQQQALEGALYKRGVIAKT